MMARADLGVRMREWLRIEAMIERDYCGGFMSTVG